MDLAFTEEQELIRRTATDVMAAEMPKQRVLELDEGPTGFAPDLWQRMASLGWTGLAIPEEYGGLGRPYTDFGVLQEILGRAACPSPILDSCALSAQAILEAGDDSQKRALLPPIAAGQQIVTLAFTEPEYAWGASAIHMRATRSRDNYVLNGTKLFIPWAAIADQLLVAARTSDSPNPEQGISLFLVDKNARGVSVRQLSGWIADRACEVKLDNVQVPASRLLGAEGQAWPALDRAFDRATAVLNTYMAGGAERAYEMCREYSQSRVAFGVPIGTFQFVQAHVLGALNDAEGAYWTAYEALWRLDSNRPDASIGVSGAKAVCSVGFYSACDHSHDVHAGVGIDLELGLTHYTKRSRTFQQYLGDAVYHKRRMARLMNL